MYKSIETKRCLIVWLKATAFYSLNINFLKGVFENIEKGKKLDKTH